MSETKVTVERMFAPNGEGWELALRRTTADVPAAGRRPIFIVPGYGMNSFIFGYHPSGLSLEGYLATRGFEVWSADLRAQGLSRRRETGGRREQPPGLADLALTDVPAALAYILGRSATGADRADIIGCSLGATLMLAQAGVGRDRRMASLVNFGGPLRWVRVHPALRVAFASPTLVGLLPFYRTRDFARLALPVVARVPGLLSLYMNTPIRDVAHVAEMVKTVEDPVPRINREIAEWIKARDLVLRGENVTRAVGALKNPFLCVVAMGDGIVPPETALSSYHAIGSSTREVLQVGDEARAIAHADLFLCEDAAVRVFEPVARWLEAQP